MPTYSYKCTECGTAFDIQQAFTDDTLTECPNCGGKLRKIFSAVGVTFNGSGFYRNDSRETAKSSGKGGSGKSSDASGSESKSSDSKSSGSASSESKSSDSQGSGSKSSGSAAEGSKSSSSAPSTPAASPTKAAG